MNNLNPFTLLDSLLEDYASPAARRIIHTILLVVVAVVAIWMAAEGDWKKFVVALGVAFYAEANRANTNPDAGMAEGVGFYGADYEDAEPHDPYNR